MRQCRLAFYHRLKDKGKPKEAALKGIATFQVSTISWRQTAHTLKLANTFERCLLQVARKLHIDFGIPQLPIGKLGVDWSNRTRFSQRNGKLIANRQPLGTETGDTWKQHGFDCARFLDTQNLVYIVACDKSLDEYKCHQYLNCCVNK